MDFKKELIQLLDLPLNSSHRAVHAQCLVQLTTAPKTKKMKTAKSKEV